MSRIVLNLLLTLRTPPWRRRKNRNDNIKCPTGLPVRGLAKNYISYRSISQLSYYYCSWDAAALMLGRGVAKRGSDADTRSFGYHIFYLRAVHSHEYIINAMKLRFDFGTSNTSLLWGCYVREGGR